MTNDGMFLENRRPLPKKLPTEVFRFIRRPAKRGRKLFLSSYNQPSWNTDTYTVPVLVSGRTLSFKS
jgi:hypothetical protein